MAGGQVQPDATQPLAHAAAEQRLCTSHGG